MVAKALAPFDVSATTFDIAALFLTDNVRFPDVSYADGHHSAIWIDRVDGTRRAAVTYENATKKVVTVFVFSTLTVADLAAALPDAKCRQEESDGSLVCSQSERPELRYEMVESLDAATKVDVPLSSLVGTGVKNVNHIEWTPTRPRHVAFTQTPRYPKDVRERCERVLMHASTCDFVYDAKRGWSAVEGLEIVGPGTAASRCDVVVRSTLPVPNYDEAEVVAIMSAKGCEKMRAALGR